MGVHGGPPRDDVLPCRLRVERLHRPIVEANGVLEHQRRDGGVACSL